MTRRGTTDISDIVPYSERVDNTRVPTANHFLIERHRPARFDSPYHHHTSVEINYLRGCEMAYSFSGKRAHLLPDRITVFWGAAPHTVADVVGQGEITNVYLSLGQFMRWGMPARMVEAILSGTVISARPTPLFDGPLFDRLFAERDRISGPWRRIHLSELESRLRRIGLEGWDVRLDPGEDGTVIQSEARSMLHVEAILRTIADNFSRPVSVADIAQAVNLSPGHAMTLFRQVMGVSIKEHLTRTRLSHARMLLTETDHKIVTIALDSGFGSLSSFYEAFKAAHRVSPARYRRDTRQLAVTP